MNTHTTQLSNWNLFDEHAPSVGAEFFGFKSGLAQVNRFAARFRAAKSFKGIVLEGYSSTTTAGYAALCRVLFVYSAFETYLEITGNTQASIGPSLEEYGAKDLLSKLRALDSNDRFYKFIYERVNKKHKRELDSYFKDDPCNVAYLASAVRHIFAHGWLTPSAGGGESREAEAICRELNDFLLEFMDRSFFRMVEAGIDLIFQKIAPGA